MMLSIAISFGNCVQALDSARRLLDAARRLLDAARRLLKHSAFRKDS